MTTDELKPCPHCLYSQVDIDMYEPSPSFWQIGCGACSSHSGIAKIKQRVVDLWNNRPHEDKLQRKLDRAIETLSLIGNVSRSCNETSEACQALAAIKEMR